MTEIGQLAASLDDAAGQGRLVSATPGLAEADAYRAQELLLERHTARGARLIGRKLGLTSPAKQRQMGVETPVHGFLTDAMLVDGDTLERDGLVQPRIEPEIALRLRRPLRGASRAEAVAAIGSVHGALEILDSRYEAFSFDLGAVIADNTSAARVIVGEPAPVDDLKLEGVVLELDGDIVATAAGAATMGDPLLALSWLSQRVGLQEGDLVLTGGLTEAFGLDGVHRVCARYASLPAVRLEVRP